MAKRSLQNTTNREKILQTYLFYRSLKLPFNVPLNPQMFLLRNKINKFSVLNLNIHSGIKFEPFHMCS